MSTAEEKHHHDQIMFRQSNSLGKSDKLQDSTFLKSSSSDPKWHRPQPFAKFPRSRHILCGLILGGSCSVMESRASVTYQWTGGTFGSFFTAQSWQDDIGQNPSSLSSSQPLDAGFHASSTQLSTSSSQLLLGTGSLHLTNASLASGWPAQVAVIGNDAGPPSTVSLSGTSLLIARSLNHLDLQINGGSLVDLHATRSGHESGNVVLGSTINITEGGMFNLLYTDSTFLSPVTAEEVLSAYFSVLTYEGSAIELGLDPTVVEAGDNMVMYPRTTTSMSGSWTSGWGFTPIPEPATPLLATLTSLLLLRRHRTEN